MHASDRVAFFLRGINLGARNKVPMAVLRELATELGAAQVATYVASGNLACLPGTDPDAFAAALQGAVLERTGVTSPVLWRDSERLEHICTVAASADPPEPKLYHVMLLERAVSSQVGDDLPVVPDEPVQVDGTEIHVQYASGAHGAKVSHALLERRLKMTVTARNLRTMLAMRDLVQS